MLNASQVVVVVVDRVVILDFDLAAAAWVGKACTIIKVLHIDEIYLEYGLIIKIKPHMWPLEPKN